MKQINVLKQTAENTPWIALGVLIGFSLGHTIVFVTEFVVQQIMGG